MEPTGPKLTDKQEQKRRHNLKHRYGITPEQYDELLRSQGGRCACCGTKNPGGSRCWNVDHCHDTGQVRGLLCINCNNGIGKLGDDWVGVTRGILYLLRTKTCTTATILASILTGALENMEQRT